jgi:hypothetical protein
MNNQWNLLKVEISEIITDTRSATQHLNGASLTRALDDINANVDKLTAWMNDPSNELFKTFAFQFLHSIGQDEKESPSVWLLWLDRGIEFLKALCDELLDNTVDLGVAALNAYNRTLFKHHNFLVRTWVKGTLGFSSGAAIVDPQKIQDISQKIDRVRVFTQTNDC